VSVGELDKVIAALPDEGRTLDDVQALAKAAGKSLNPKEASRLGALVTKEWTRFEADGLAALEAMTGYAAPDKAPTPLTVAQRWYSEIDEQSGFTFVSPEVGFLAVDDETSTVWQVGLPTTIAGSKLAVNALREDDGTLTDLEGAAYDAEAGALFVVSESTSEVSKMSVDVLGGGLTLGAPETVGELPKLGTNENKGWEGIAMWPSNVAPDGHKHLLAVNEGSPRMIALVSPETFEIEAEMPMPPSLADEPEDISDIAADPETGRVFLLSDASCAIYELDLDRRAKIVLGGAPVIEWAPALVQKIELPELKKGRARLQPEGLAFDHQGDLWVLAEGDRSMIQLVRG